MTNPKKRTVQLSKSELAEMLVCKRQRIDYAYKRLCDMRQISMDLGPDGNCVNRDVARVVEWANDVYVTRDSMHYRLKRDKKKAEATAATETVTMIPIVVATTEESITTLNRTSTPALVANNTDTNTVANNTNEWNGAGLICYSQSLAGTSTSSIDTNNTNSDVSTASENILPSVPIPVFTLGMSSKTKKQLAVTYVATLFQQEKSNIKCTSSQVSHGTLDRIIDQATKELDLEPGTINKWTVQRRVQTGNLAGINHRNISPIHDLEMDIAMAIIERSRQGATTTMSREEVIQYAKAASAGTIHARNFNNFVKKKRPNDLPLTEEVAEIGLGWYEGFQKRHRNLLKRGHR